MSVVKLEIPSGRMNYNPDTKKVSPDHAKGLIKVELVIKHQ